MRILIDAENDKLHGLMDILEKLGLVRKVEVIKEVVVNVYPRSELKIGDNVVITYMSNSVRGIVKSKPFFAKPGWSNEPQECIMVSDHDGKEHFPTVSMVSKIEL